MIEEHPQRKYAAILWVDMVASTNLKDESEAWSRLNGLWQDLIGPTIAAESSLAVKRMGDGLLAVFASAVTAVTCAIEIQRRFREYQIIEPNAAAIALRIGVHVGDVFIGEDNVVGNAVNVAARLEAIAEPGGILISEDAWEQARGKVPASFVNAGEQRFKSLTDPIRVYRLDTILNPAFASDPAEPRRLQVFVSYAHADKEIALEIAGALRGTGYRIWIAEWELAIGDTIAERIEDAMRSSDILLVLLSPSSVHSRWIRNEISSALSQELQERAIRVIPALVQDCDIPPMFSDRTLIDLRGELRPALKRLVEQIGAASDLDFKNLDYRAFEQLAVELLRRLGFLAELTSTSRDAGVDIVASRSLRDPFGAMQTETWIVQAKLYHKQRISVDQIRALAGLVSVEKKRGLIITNSQLTSVAWSFLAESIEKFGVDLRVIDGTKLTSLLVQHPDLIRKYAPPKHNDA